MLRNTKLLPSILSAVLLLISAEIAYSDENFGRLFTDANQRLLLDRLRNSDKSKLRKNASTYVHRTIGNANKSDSHFSVNGYVTRGNGRSIIWADKKKQSRYKVVPMEDGSHVIQVIMPGIGSNIQLKPGQVYMLESGQTLEAYELNKSARLDPKKKDDGKSADKVSDKSGRTDSNIDKNK